MKEKTVLRPKNEHGLLTWKLATLTMVLIFGGVLTATTHFLTTKGIDPLEFYTNMANPYMRFAVINPGMRKEEMAMVYSKTLNWSEKDRRAFLNTATDDEGVPTEGYYFPSSYWFNINASGAEVGKTMVDTFHKKVQSLLAKKVRTSSGNINVDTAVRIASIIQREAAGPQDSRLVSGVIWNRLFRGMTLAMDATVQYAKGTSTDWWPQVTGKDTKIYSPYNTYQNKGLPPTAISNPGIDAIAAAFNPQNTPCLFYIHDKNSQIHCSTTYAEHKQNIQTYLVDRR